MPTVTAALSRRFGKDTAAIELDTAINTTYAQPGLMTLLS